MLQVESINFDSVAEMFQSYGTCSRTAAKQT